MRKLIVLALLMAGACQTPCTSGPAIHERLVFSCSDGSQLAATFEGERLRVEQDGYPGAELPSRYAGTGYRYAGGGLELRGRGGQAIWSRPGSGEVTCSAPLRRA